ncbi:MAG TPA: FIST N-terminal domain-containing protein [Anaeromyxobacteraceae bacterium]|nr:FIST N-terminal domain-containing protein [Anaeromyxobacteraceae bacterium]
MKWASALSCKAPAPAAFLEAAAELDERLGGASPDLLLAFASAGDPAGCEAVGELAAQRYPGALLAGCTGHGVIGDAREAEEVPAVALTAAVLPEVECTGFHVDMTTLPDPDAEISLWTRISGATAHSRPSFLLLADPFTIDADALIEGLDHAYPGAPKVGGLASGGEEAGDHRLLLGRDVHRSGAVGIALRGDVEVETIIAQGCRPIGQPMLVTRCHGGVVHELDRGTPLKVLGELFQSLDVRDRALMQESLFVGLDMREERVEYDPHELLVRNIVGADQQSGAVAIGAALRPMQVVQFMLRDAHTAEEDLRRMLDRRRHSGKRARGALLFSCTGRGAGLFGHPDHDTGMFEETLGPVPLGGFFCNGEIGPVGGVTFLHGYTSAFALFRESRPPPDA